MFPVGLLPQTQSCPLNKTLGSLEIDTLTPEPPCAGVIVCRRPACENICLKTDSNGGQVLGGVGGVELIRKIAERNQLWERRTLKDTFLFNDLLLDFTSGVIKSNLISRKKSIDHTWV